MAIDLERIQRESKEMERRLAQERLRPSRLLADLDEVAQILADQWDHLNRTQIEALKLRANITMDLLKKSVPDLKPIDYDDGSDRKQVEYVFEQPSNVVELKLDGGK